MYTIVHFRTRDLGLERTLCVWVLSRLCFCGRGHIERDYGSNRGEVATFGRILARFVVRFWRLRKNVYVSTDRYVYTRVRAMWKLVAPPCVGTQNEAFEVGSVSR